MADSALSGLATADGVIVAGGFEEVDLRSVTEAFGVVGWAQDECLREDDWIAVALSSSPTQSTAS